MNLNANSSPRLFCIRLFGCKCLDQAWALGKLKKAVRQESEGAWDSSDGPIHNRNRFSSDLNGWPCSNTAVILSHSLGICTASTAAGGEGDIKQIFHHFDIVVFLAPLGLSQLAPWSFCRIYPFSTYRFLTNPKTVSTVKITVVSSRHHDATQRSYIPLESRDLQGNTHAPYMNIGFIYVQIYICQWFSLVCWCK